MTFDEEEQGKLRDGDPVALELVRDQALAAMGGDPELQKELGRCVRRLLGHGTYLIECRARRQARG